MSMEQKDIAGLRALAEKATPGPWYECGLPWFQNGYGVMAGSPDPHVGYIIADTETWEGDRAEYLENDGPVKNLAGPDTDAAFIAACDPQTIISLLDALTELSSTLASLTADKARVDELLTAAVDDYNEVKGRLAQAEARVKELEGALAFYADSANWKSRGFEPGLSDDGSHRTLTLLSNPIRDDRGRRARALLRSQEPASGEAGT